MADNKDTEIEVFPVKAPTLGIVGHVPSTMLDPRACVDCNNVRFKNGIVSTRTGYVAYGSGDLTGILLLFFRYQKWNGQEYEMLATTTDVYYNKGGVWTSIKSDLGGDPSVRASMANIENHLVFTNGVDAPSKWTGSVWSNLNAEHVADTYDWGDYRPVIFLPFHFRLVGFNDNKITTGAAIRIMYSRAGNFDRIDHEGYSGFIDMTQGMGARIVGAAPLKNYVGMYKDYSCALLSYIGGASTFAISVQIEGIGLAAKDAIANLGTSHMFLGSDLNIYQWNGGTELVPIGDPIKEALRAEVNKTKINRSFAVVNIDQKEVIFFLPIGSNEYPTRMWIYNLRDESWARGTIAALSSGSSVTKAGTERMLLGTGRVYWESVFDGSAEPGSVGWSLGGTDYASSDGSVLTIDTSTAPAEATDLCYYTKWPGVNLKAGFTVKFKAQVVSSVGDYPFVVEAFDDTNNLWYRVYIRDGSIYHEDEKICNYDTTHAYHVYRIVTSDTTATLYIEGVAVGDSWTLQSSNCGDGISWGDKDTESSINILIDYFYFGFGVLDEPELTASAIKHYDYEALTDGGAVISSKFETGDFVLDNIEHLIKNRRYYGVGLDLKGYPAPSKLTLEHSANEGADWDTTDKVTKTLTDAYALYNWDFLKTYRKIRFKFSDATSGQRWYLRFFGIKQKEGERV